MVIRCFIAIQKFYELALNIYQKDFILVRKMEKPLVSDKEQQAVVSGHKNNHHLPSVIVVRDWKEYLGESVLIIFSVLLALILTEVFNRFHEKQQTKEILSSVREELTDNERLEKEQYDYHLQVLKNIDSSLKYSEFQRKFISNGMINLDLLAPHGILLHDLNDVAWQVAKQANIISKINLKTYGLLTEIYDNQQRITNFEQEIANVMLSRESRTAADNRITLILMRDNYHGWATDRAPKLLDNYRKAIEALHEY